MSHLRMPSIVTTLISATSLVFASPINKDTGAYSFSSDIYGPFEEFQDDVTITIHVIPPTITGLSLDRILILDKEGSIIYSTGSTAHNASRPYDYMVTLPTKDYLSYEGMHCRYEIERSKTGVVSQIDFILYPYSKKHPINPFDYNNSSYNSRQKAFYFKDNGIKFIEEKFSFKDLEDYFLTNSYYKLSLDQFKFDSFLYGNLSYKDAYLVLDDLIPSFLSLSNESNNSSKIPLSLKINENATISLQFKDLLYVEPSSLHMSTRPKSGYVATKYFFLPTNKKEEVSTQSFRFEINELGYNKTYLSWNIEYTNTINLIGDCSNSEYCVVGGSK